MLTEKNTRRGRLLQQYVTARITRLDGINLGLFDFDRYNTLYFFALNADEQIYLRYGGRDERGFTSYLDLESLELALERGLELHRLHREGRFPAKPAPPARYARGMPVLRERTIESGRCVECHLVADLEYVQLEREGTLDRIAHLYRAPEIRKIGIELDVPRGLRVARATGRVADAGMVDGDEIRTVNGVHVWTFADFQWEYGNLSHNATALQIGVERNGRPVDLTVDLPPLWWHTDLTYRNLSVDPRIYFRSSPLTSERKTALGLDPGGFASRVESIDPLAELLSSHQLLEDDVVYGVDGTFRDSVATTADQFIKFRKQAGTVLTLQVLRGSERIEMQLKTERMSFRK